MSILAVPCHLSLVKVLQPVSLALTDLERTLLAADNIKVIAYVHITLSRCCVDCGIQETGG